MKVAKAEKDLVNHILSKVKSVPQEQAKAMDPTVLVQKRPIEASPKAVTSEEQQQIQQYLQDRSDKFYHNNYDEKNNIISKHVMKVSRDNFLDVEGSFRRGFSMIFSKASQATFYTGICENTGSQERPTPTESCCWSLI